jgi:hypothetical protein
LGIDVIGKNGNISATISSTTGAFMFILIILATSLCIPCNIYGASASASSVLGKRNASGFDNVPGLDSEADVKMKDVEDQSGEPSKKQKLNQTENAHSTNSMAMEIDAQEIAHELPPHNDNARLLQLYNHYDFASPFKEHKKSELGRALYALRKALDGGENIDTPCGGDEPALHGETLLHFAIHGNIHEFIALFLNRGAHVHTPRHRDNSTPLHYAVGGVAFDPYDGYAPCFGLEERTLALFANRGFDFSRRDRKGLTPLLASLAYWGKTHHIRFLLSQGADATAVTNGHGALWMLFNCENRYRYERQYDRSHNMTMIRADHNHWLNITKLLVIAGTDFQSTCPEGRSPLYDAWVLRSKASRYGCEKAQLEQAISWLICVGAPVTAPNNEMFWAPQLVDEDHGFDESTEKRWQALRQALPSSLCSTALTTQPSGAWSHPFHCGNLINSYLHTHPLIEEGYRQRELFNQLQTERLTAITSNLDRHELRDMAALIHHLAGPLIVEHYPEADAKRDLAAQVAPMEVG